MVMEMRPSKVIFGSTDIIFSVMTTRGGKVTKPPGVQEIFELKIKKS